MVLEKTLESPLDIKRSTQSILKEISPEYSLEGVMLKLKLQYFAHLMRRTDSFEDEEKKWRMKLEMVLQGEKAGGTGWGWGMNQN